MGLRDIDIDNDLYSIPSRILFYHVKMDSLSLELDERFIVHNTLYLSSYLRDHIVLILRFPNY